MSLNQTPNANRLHIAIFGRRNSGKSSLLNAITGQDMALVSDTAGTTTDPVFKAMEISPLGPCVFIDTAGFDDEGELGELRVQKTKAVLDKADIAMIVFTDAEFSLEREWVSAIKERKIPFLLILNKIDIYEDAKGLTEKITKTFGKRPILVSALRQAGMEEIKEELARSMPEEFEQKSITRHLVKEKDVVLLVMPQDIQAPKGRLILPQVQTIRDLLDNQCIVICTTTNQLDDSLAALSRPPALIVTDSQVFHEVYQKKPDQSILTSFSVLFARYKGDIEAYLKGASAFDTLKGTERILIAEACTHAPLDGDIGRVKLPDMLRKKFGAGIQIDLVAGVDFPKDLSTYDLIIHCGGCMFNRKYILSRIEKAEEQKIPITNYGIAIAKLTGILESVEA